MLTGKVQNGVSGILSIKQIDQMGLPSLRAVPVSLTACPLSLLKREPFWSSQGHQSAGLEDTKSRPRSFRFRLVWQISPQLEFGKTLIFLGLLSMCRRRRDSYLKEQVQLEFGQ